MKAVHYFREMFIFILDVWIGSEYTFGDIYLSGFQIPIY